MTSKEDLSRLVQYASYEAAFGVLYMLEDPGIDEDEAAGLHESLLSADPSGKGRTTRLLAFTEFRLSDLDKENQDSHPVLPVFG